MPEVPLRVYLDANILFSASYKSTNTLLDLWRLRAIQPVTSFYAVEEARRNATLPGHSHRLETLLEKTGLVSDADVRCVPAHITLAAKDRPILAAAIFTSVDYLVTGDAAHFGHLYNTAVGHVRVLRPAEFLLLYKNRLKQ